MIHHDRAAQYNINITNTSTLRSPQFAAIAETISRLGGFNSKETFNAFCKDLISTWRDALPTPLGKTSQFSSYLNSTRSGGEGSIPTSWGGVQVMVHNHPHVEKYLVVKGGHYLAFETHEKKEEFLDVREGAGIIIYRPKPDAPLMADVLLPGKKIALPPGHEHCVIGTEDLLIYETSEDYKGMDQDLIFIFLPD